MFRLQVKSLKVFLEPLNFKSELKKAVIVVRKIIFYELVAGVCFSEVFAVYKLACCYLNDCLVLWNYFPVKFC